MIKHLIAAAVAASLFTVAAAAHANEAGSDGLPSTQSPHFYHAPGADQAVDGTTGQIVGDSWLFLAGSAFTPRTSSQAVTYPGGGCSFSDAAITTSLELPENASIYGVRVYYYSTSPANKLNFYLSTYPGDGTATDLLVGSSTLGVGYATEYFEAPSPLVVSNFSGAYALTARTFSNTRFCGMRVFYAR